MKLPFITEELIDYLEQLYPDKMPDGNLTETKFTRLQGSIDVVRHLKAIRKQQMDQSILGEKEHVSRQPRSASPARTTAAAPAHS